MEKKRKLPARASARVGSANKRRNITPRERSETPAPPPPVVKEPTPPPPLPKSIQPGKPLPTVEDVQPEDLSAKEYQSISESGVLVESLTRSRHRWISDGLFEKFWTKPFKRKGVVNEDPNNPPKDSMTKVGTVTITIEPHIVEATMFAVKESRLRPQESQQQTPKSALQQTPVRPILQYGPPNGAMPPPSTPKSMTPAPNATTTAPTSTAAQSSSDVSPRSSSQGRQAPATSGEAQKVQSPANAANVAPSSSLSPSLPLGSLAPPPVASATAPQLARTPSRPPSEQNLASEPSVRTPLSGSTAANPTSAARLVVNGAPGQQPPVARPPAPPGQSPAPSPAPASKPAPNDPVIALLAQRASRDATLRDLMKRVAMGQAKDGELAHFQKIIDQLSAEYRRSGGQQGPSADRLLVDGRTVKYFADEVRAITDIVLASNPYQKSGDLRPPPRSDPLVVLLVKTALEDQRTKDMIVRIADGCPGFTDATDLKEILDRLHRDAKTAPQGLPASSSSSSAAAAATAAARTQTANGLPNGNPKTPQTCQTPSTPQTTQQPSPQILRSQGPPPTSKPDLAAVVFDFGNGDRYVFPRYSILEYIPTTSGQEVVASFLIVRKGSISEYGGDPELDYYQPVTIRIAASSGRHLENLARVVAPPEEVRRYMDDVMDNMTRAEYVLLAMRLPRASKLGDKEAGSFDDSNKSSLTPQTESEVEQTVDILDIGPPVLWTTNAVKPSKQFDLIQPQDPEQKSEMKYQRLIQSVAAKNA